MSLVVDVESDLQLLNLKSENRQAMALNVLQRCGSIGDLTTSSLLERRRQKTNLTLNISSDGGAASTPSPSEVKPQISKKRGLFDRRQSKPSISLTIPVTVIASEPAECGGEEIAGPVTTPRRKFFNLQDLDAGRRSRPITPITPVESPCGCVRKITTKPLSPQTTSEDFRNCLENMQTLQNASNPLDDHTLHTLSEVFNENNSEDLASLDERVRELHQEFWNLPTNYQEKSVVFGAQAKNRYKTILPNEHSRVRLECGDEPKKLSKFSFDTAPYINANYIKGFENSHHAYIATQGPMTNTIHDFWSMIEQNIKRAPAMSAPQKIVMLTPFTENSKSKCAEYFPENLNDFMIFPAESSPDESQLTILREKYAADDAWQSPISDAAVDFDYFCVKTVEVTAKNGYSTRRLRVIRSTAQPSRVDAFDCEHFWLPEWADHCSPENIDAVLDLCLDLCGGSVPLIAEPINPLPVIHCSAGIGRTGCLVAILNGLRQILAHHEPSVDILGIVSNLRLQRGGLVENAAQYEFIHRAICVFRQRLMGKRSRF